jgi:ATP-dependent DNA helicase RecG
MITKEIAIQLISNLESERIERTISFRKDKLGPIVCAFANDFSNNKLPSYIILGVNDDGSINGMNIGDEQLLLLGDLKSNGWILPQPSITVSDVFQIENGQVVIVEVMPSLYPPVRFEGRCWIRTGPRKSMATVDEEKILIERRASYAKTFDLIPALGSKFTDISIEHFKLNYLPLAIDKETLDVNGRSTEEQLAALRFYDLKENCPTHAGLLVFGIQPLIQIPGAYIQYVKFDGKEMHDQVQFEKEFSGAYISELNVINDFIKANIIKERPVKKDNFKEENQTNYPFWALRELIMNAIMHRNYESNAPIYIYEFTNRIEIHNPGGLFGDVNASNFPNASGYRNVVLAETLKILGYVNRFNYGVKRAIFELEKNGNGIPVFDLTLTTKFKVTVNINSEWLNLNKN